MGHSGPSDSKMKSLELIESLKRSDMIDSVTTSASTHWNWNEMNKKVVNADVDLDGLKKKKKG